MGFKSRLFSAILMATVSTSLASPSQADTLADAMAGAYGHSGLLDQNRALLRVADENVALATSSLRPIISWAADVRRTAIGGSSPSASNTANVALSMSWLLADGGASRASIEAAKQTVLATRQQLVGVEQLVLTNAVVAFMNVRRDTEIVALRQNNLRLITRELRAAKDRFEVGEVTRTDVALAEARLAGARAELAVAQGNLMQSQESYIATVGRKPNGLVAPNRLPYTAKTLDEAKAVAVRSHPDMVGAQFQVAAAEFNIRAAEANMRPNLELSATATGSRQIGGSVETDTGILKLETSGPIYRGGQLSAALRQAMARRDAARGSLHATRHGIRQQVGAAWAQVLAARAQREASSRQIRAARVAFDGVSEEAKLGARTTLDVLNAEQELLDAQANMISAQSSEFTATYGLLAAMGLLTVDHLNLAVEKYDPEAYYKQVQSAPTIKSKRGEQLDKVLRAIGKE